MGGAPVKAEKHTLHAQHAAFGGVVGVARVEVKGGIQIVKRAIAPHVDFAAASLLGRAAIVAHRAGRSGLLQPLLNGNGSGQTACTQQIVAAAVAVAACFNGVGVTLQLLRQPRQGIILPSKANDGATAAPFGHKGGADAADIPGDGKANFF